MPIEYLIIFLGFFLAGESTRSEFIQIDGTKNCITIFDNKCITHEDLQDEDGLLDLDKAKKYGLV
jgi:hypothetical protein